MSNAATAFAKVISRKDDEDESSTTSTTPTVIATPVPSWEEPTSSLMTSGTCPTIDDIKDATLLYIDREVVREELGYGPSRFAIDITKQRSIEDQLINLSMEEKMCYDNLKLKWEEVYKPFPYNDWYLRFAKCSPGNEKFNEATAWKVMLNFNRKYSNISKFNIQSVEEQLWTKTLFPVPGLKTKDGGHDMLYFRPSRFFPKVQSTETIINNLVYVVNSMLEKEETCTNGIGMLINMKDWNQKENYSVFNRNYFFQFMKILQGAIPVRIRSIVILHPPTWFTNKIWPLLRPMLSKERKEKIHMVHNDSELCNYLAPDYEKVLGGSSMDDIVRDYIMYRRYIEQIRWTCHQNDLEKQVRQQQSNNDTASYHISSSIIIPSMTQNKKSSPQSLNFSAKSRCQQEASGGRRRRSDDFSVEQIEL